MENPETGDSVILLGDTHLGRNDMICETYHKKISDQQQSEIIEFIMDIKKDGHCVHVLVEDMKHFLNSDGNWYHITPLHGLVDLCMNKKISVTNIECRDILYMDEHKRLTKLLIRTKPNMDYISDLTRILRSDDMDFLNMKNIKFMIFVSLLML